MFVINNKRMKYIQEKDNNQMLQHLDISFYLGLQFLIMQNSWTEADF